MSEAQIFFTAFGASVAAMFPIVNPVGHAPMFYTMTEEDSSGFRRRQARKTALYTFLILLVSLLFGDTLLRFFGINIDHLRIAGGLLDDISLTPMATPILAGPGAMSLAIGLVSYGRTLPAYAGFISGFLAIGLLTWICLHFSENLVRLMSVNALGALNRVLGLLILAIGVSLVANGVKDLFFPLA